MSAMPEIMREKGAGPQLEDGHIRIANELYDAILMFPFSAREQKVVGSIMRKTYGYNKKEDDMSASQIGDLCGLARTHVTATLNSLAARNIITKKPGRFGSIMGIQKNHRKWLRDLPENLPPASTELVQGCTELGLVIDTESPQSTSTNSVPPCTELVLVPPVPIWFSASTESVQVDSTESVHTKDNLPKDNQQKTKRASRTGVCFDDWMAQVKEQGVKPIPEDHDVFGYAKEIALPIDFVRLAWLEFHKDHSGDRDKKQKSWPQTFSNYVRKNYLKLWFDKDGKWELTTRGKQAERARQSKNRPTGSDPDAWRNDPRFKGSK
jgi:phage replication O-like protein O